MNFTRRSIMLAFGLVVLVAGFGMALLRLSPGSSPAPILPTLASLPGGNAPETLPEIAPDTAIVTLVPDSVTTRNDSAGEDGAAAVAGGTAPDTAVTVNSVALNNSAPESVNVVAAVNNNGLRAPDSTAALPVGAVPGTFVVRLQPGTTLEAVNAYAAQHNARVIRQLAGLNSVVIELPASVTTLPESRLFAAAEPDYYITPLLMTPDDPYYTSQWNLNVIGAPEAWTLLPATTLPVTVAVIDSGVCADHPDLAGRILDSGRDFVQNDNVPQDEYGHGCGVAGVLA
ncbi:MAG: S8 family serine peptidase, partial [Anaerolineae bacterium]|nr:S8 family serine peptidase [Anaerolineae bacterium]